MGNYGNLPKRLPIKFNPRQDQFQSQYVQRVKQTPFSYSEPYSLQPPIFIDGIDIKMGDLVKPRMTSNQYFPPPEILKIMQNITAGLLQLQERGYAAHGDLSFDTIYYDKRNKLFKISHPIFSPESGFQLTKQGKRFSFLSPQQLLALTDPEENIANLVSIKSDKFILGVIMLQICTLLPSNQIYCPDTYIIFDKQIQNRYQLIKQCYEGEPKYYQTISSILKKMLEYDQSNRKTCKQILWEIQQTGLIKPAINIPPSPTKIIKQSPHTINSSLGVHQ